jgi:DNA-binding response OmpR family regulator
VDLSTRHHIDLLLLDLSQPLRTGSKIFERLRTLHTHVPVVTLTEHKAAYEQAVADRPCVVLQKPFDVAALTHAVHSLLGMPSPGDALPAKPDEGFREVTTESDDFREKLLRRYTAPYQLPSPHRQWGINE